MAKPKNKMLLYGRISVFERLKHGPKTIKRVFIQDNINLPHVEKLIRENKIPLERIDSKRLSKMKPSKDLQGIIAQIDKFRYASFDDLLAQAQNNNLSLIFLDRITDPHNLGAIMRTAACLGKFAIVIPQFNACSVTEAVLHVASGGENFVPLAMVSSLSTAILQAKESGCWIMGADYSKEAISIDEVSFPFPLGFVLGSEGEGIRYGVEKHLDMKVSIPMRGVALSLNVSVACAIFCYQISKQRKV